MLFYLYVKRFIQVDGCCSYYVTLIQNGRHSHNYSTILFTEDCVCCHTNNYNKNGELIPCNLFRTIYQAICGNVLSAQELIVSIWQCQMILIYLSLSTKQHVISSVDWRLFAFFIMNHYTKDII